MDYVARSGWGARPAKSKVLLATGNIEGIFVHHSVTPTGPDEAALVRNIQAFHMDTRGWNDIAYNWLVGQSGTIYEGRGWLVNGGHTEGWNFRSHAVCFIGNSDSDVPTPQAERALSTVIAESVKRFGGFVKPHSAVNQTGCPGKHLTAWVAGGGYRPAAPAPGVPSAPAPSEEDNSHMATRQIFQTRVPGTTGPNDLMAEVSIAAYGLAAVRTQTQPNSIFTPWFSLHSDEDPQPFPAVEVTAGTNADGRQEIVVYGKDGRGARKVRNLDGSWRAWAVEA